MNHKHEATQTNTYAWSTCVAVPSQHCDGTAHGGVTHVEECACGAVRKIESNGKHVLTGYWFFVQETP